MESGVRLDIVCLHFTCDFVLVTKLRQNKFRISLHISPCHRHKGNLP